MNKEKLVGDLGYLLTQLEMAYNYINSITHLSLNVTLEEFERNLNLKENLENANTHDI
jgi:hypothetical protein